jgi:hypothetical protein
VGVEFDGFYVVEGDSVGGEELVEEHAGAGADLPFGDVQQGEIGGGGNTARVTGCDEQALFAPPQVQQVGAAVAEQGAGEGRVVDAALVTQVDSGAIGATAGEGAQSLEASAGADRDHRRVNMGQQDQQRRVVAAGQPEHPVRFERAAAAIAPSVATLARRRAARVITAASARYR